MAKEKTECPNMATCDKKQLWRRPEWKAGKEPEGKFAGVKIGEKVVPCGHCIPHEHTAQCDRATSKCPACIPAKRGK